MTEKDAEIILHLAQGKFPEVKPGVDSGNDLRFFAPEFMENIRLMIMIHALLSVLSSGTENRSALSKTIKSECIRPKQPIMKDAGNQVAGHIR